MDRRGQEPAQGRRLLLVLANVTPIMERGETICYASVRVKPTREQVEAAEAVYARLRSGARGVR